MVGRGRAEAPGDGCSACRRRARSAARTRSPRAAPAASGSGRGSRAAGSATRRPRRRAAPRRAGRACTGCCGSANSSCTGASSALRPAYMTSTRSAMSATTPRLCVIRMIAVPSWSRMSREQVEDPGLDRHVERGRRLVGDQHLRLAGERDRDHDALPHAAGELVRVGVEPLLRRRDVHEPQQLDRPVACLTAREAEVSSSAPRRSASRP